MAGINHYNLKFTSALFDGREVGYLKDGTMDMELGKKNDFEIQIDSNHWNCELYNYGNRIYIPGTEYGGIMNECEVNTENSKIALINFVTSVIAELIMSGSLFNIPVTIFETKSMPEFSICGSACFITVKNCSIRFPAL